MKPVIEEFASEVRRMKEEAVNTQKKMRKEAEERRSQALAEIRSNLNLLRRSSEEFRKKFNENVRNRMHKIWGTHPPGTKVTDIL
jgi:cell fate (sporulation/competence/biofilm development) regulator YmcA (YheA/YmcA/DUF963 family)